MVVDQSEHASFTLRAMTEHDIPTCAEISHQAFLSDRHTQLKAANPTNPYNHGEAMRGYLQILLSRPQGKADLIVAEDEHTNEILGWVGWGYRGFDQVDCNQEAIQPQRQHLSSNGGPDPTKAISHPPAPPRKPELSDSDIASLSDRDRLESYTSADMAAWMGYLMPPGTKCMYVITITVAPMHQGRGVGRALLLHGTTVADVQGVFCWVQASEAGEKGFSKAGFAEIGRLYLDLDEWNLQGVAPPPSSISSELGASRDEVWKKKAGDCSGLEDGKTRRWGHYILRYMRREPLI